MKLSLLDETKEQESSGLIIKNEFILTAHVHEIEDQYEVLDWSTNLELPEVPDDGILEHALYLLAYDRYPELNIRMGESKSVDLSISGVYHTDYWGEVDVDIDIIILGENDEKGNI